MALIIIADDDPLVGDIVRYTLSERGHIARGTWPERARVACVALVAASKAGTPSLGIKLLADLRTIFGSEDHLGTEDILAKLHRLEESPWGDLRGKPLDARGLAQRLRPYDIKPTTVRIFASTPKGYRREDLHDAWARYLGPSPNQSATSATSETEATSSSHLPRWSAVDRAILAPGENGDEPVPGWAA